MILSGWGRYPKLDCRIIDAHDRGSVAAAVAANDTLIAHGNGRSYGDSALNPAATLAMRGLNKVLSFEPETGRLTCEGGVLLSDLIDIYLPRGWFVPVTPGTKFVTVGGMIASDVHGKNHHGAGSFGDHVEALTLALADGRFLTCSPTENAQLFVATRGGMGLTGVILQATFRMMPVETRMIRRETLRARNLEEVMAQFEASRKWTYSVAWIDCLSSGAARGRSILYLGEHAGRDEVQARGLTADLAAPPRSTRRIPFDFPGFALNRWSVRAFNALYYGRAKTGSDFVELDGYFYPLDAILEWNRIYGSSGFFQYQCVLPKSAGPTGMAALLDRIAAGGRGSFLTVLKLFGPQSAGFLSFPMEGYTLALDFRADRASLALAEELDAIVLDHGGRLYLAKDSRMSRTMLRGYPDIDRFRTVRDAVDPKRKFASLQSGRLGF